MICNEIEMSKVGIIPNPPSSNPLTSYRLSYLRISGSRTQSGRLHDFNKGNEANEPTKYKLLTERAKKEAQAPTTCLKSSSSVFSHLLRNLNIHWKQGGNHKELLDLAQMVLKGTSNKEIYQISAKFLKLNKIFLEPNYINIVERETLINETFIILQNNSLKMEDRVWLLLMLHELQKNLQDEHSDKVRWFSDKEVITRGELELYLIKGMNIN